ncbi:facilitated trehalose transporter Tret1-2 homolog [Penaeus chinensis]|uniref:facilitated trehalose transporter Tret1-2 homolog n=1 Tax=Penaeus chinensis TaxID=139456 RepID=UPI001FB72317|nr:facilitated trehalose transporter Tret1-2 homolog [Penaeus chinensis]
MAGQHQRRNCDTTDDDNCGEKYSNNEENAAEKIHMLQKTADHCSNISPAVLPQVMATLATSMCMVDIGTIIAFSSLALARLTDPDSEDLVFDTDQAAFFGSVPSLGALAGSLFGIVLLVRLGQRVTNLIAIPLSFASWIALATTPTIWLVLLARFVQGLSTGLMALSCSIYIMELSHAEIRGRLVAIVDLSRQLGVLFGYGLGCTTLSWRQLALVFALTNTIIPFIGLACLPSSPRWLASRGRMDEANKALAFFRGSTYNYQPEMQDIRNQLDKVENSRKSTLGQLRQMRESFILRSMIILSFLMFGIQYNGLSAIGIYLVTIFNSANVGLNSYTSTMIVGVLRVLGSVTYLLVIDRVKRRLIFLVSCLMCGVCLILLGGYFLDQAHSGVLSSQGWIPLVTLSLFTFSSSISYPSLALLRGELIPTSVRSVAVPILYVLFFTASFISSQTYPYMVMYLGEHGTFWVYAAVNIAVGCVGASLLPETRGRTLEQITVRQQEKEESRRLNKASSKQESEP